MNRTSEHIGNLLSIFYPKKRKMENNIIEIFKGYIPQIQEQIKLKFKEHLESFNRYPVVATSREFKKMVEEISHCACSNYMRTLLNYNTVDKGAYLLPEPKDFSYAPYADRVNFAKEIFQSVQNVYSDWYVYTLIGDRKTENPEEWMYWSADGLLNIMIDRFNEQFKTI